MKLVRSSFLLLIGLVCGLSCGSDETEIFCPSDTLRFIISKNVKLKVMYDSIGRVSSLEPSPLGETFSFRGISFADKVTFEYSADGKLSTVKLASIDVIRWVYNSSEIEISTSIPDYGKYYCKQDSEGNITSRSRKIWINGTYVQSIPVNTFEYSNGNIIKNDVGAQDLHDLRRIWTSSTYNFDSAINPFYNTLRLLSLADDPILLSKNNCTSVSIVYALRNHVPTGTQNNILKYDRGGKLIYFKSGSNEQDELYFSYCKE